MNEKDEDRLEWEAERAVMIDTKKEMVRAEIAEAEGRDVPVGVVFSMIHEIDRLAEDVKRLYEDVERLYGDVEGLHEALAAALDALYAGR